MTECSKVRVIKRVDVTDLAGEKVMIDFESGNYLLIKGSGNDIWDMLGEQISVEEIIGGLMNEYDVDRETCRESVIDFLEKLEAYKFIEVIV